MTKKELEKRLKRIEEALKPEEKAICVTPSEYLELNEREKNGEKIDWDRHNFTKCGELPPETINELYERAKGN